MFPSTVNQWTRVLRRQLLFGGYKQIETTKLQYNCPVATNDHPIVLFPAIPFQWLLIEEEICTSQQLLASPIRSLTSRYLFDFFLYLYWVYLQVAGLCKLCWFMMQANEKFLDLVHMNWESKSKEKTNVHMNQIIFLDIFERHGMNPYGLVHQHTPKSN